MTSLALIISIGFGAAFGAFIVASAWKHFRAGWIDGEIHRGSPKACPRVPAGCVSKIGDDSERKSVLAARVKSQPTRANYPLIRRQILAALEPKVKGLMK